MLKGLEINLVPGSIGDEDVGEGEEAANDALGDDEAGGPADNKGPASEEETVWLQFATFFLSLLWIPCYIVMLDSSLLLNSGRLDCTLFLCQVALVRETLETQGMER